MELRCNVGAMTRVEVLGGKRLGSIWLSRYRYNLPQGIGPEGCMMSMRLMQSEESFAAANGAPANHRGVEMTATGAVVTEVRFWLQLPVQMSPFE